MNKSSISFFNLFHINSLIFLAHHFDVFASINHRRLFKLTLENCVDEIDVILLLYGIVWHIFIFFTSIF